MQLPYLSKNFVFIFIFLLSIPDYLIFGCTFKSIDFYQKFNKFSTRCACFLYNKGGAAAAHYILTDCIVVIVYLHTASKTSDSFNSMNQHFWAQNIKIYHKNDKKNATLPNHLASITIVTS